MEINALPSYDLADNPTGCCPRFNPENWDDQDLHFRDKLFLKTETRSLFHIPLNMGSVFRKISQAIDDARARSDPNFIVLSREKSPWSAEHLFAVDKEVADAEMTRLTGDFLTKVFEGPYRNMPQWCEDLDSSVKSRGKDAEATYFFYTTCPKCAKTYGKNYVVGVAQVH